LQENIPWKALDEIYMIYMLLHRPNLTISARFRRFFGVFNIRNAKKVRFLSDSAVIFADFHEICSDFHEKRCNYSKFLDFNLILS